jgi:hypothetical protein
MTSHPIPENHGAWWLVHGRWRVLHAIREDSITQQDMRTAIDYAEPLTREAVCGTVRAWVMPGMGSRLGLRRCVPCCRRLGILNGCGTPANETSLRGARD